MDIYFRRASAFLNRAYDISVQNIISPFTDGEQEEDWHKQLSGHIFIKFSLVHPGKVHGNNLHKYAEGP